MTTAASYGLALLAAAAPAAARPPFDGTWKLDTQTDDFSPQTFDISLENGVYSCRTCRPPWSVPADGAFHSVFGHEAYDETSIQAVDDRTVIFTRRKTGRGVYQAIDTISGDDKYLAFTVTEFSGAGLPIWTSGSWVRVTPRPAGSHPITGTWRELQPDIMSDNVSTFTIDTDGDTFRMTFGTGEAVTAKFGGPPATVAGDPNETLVSYRRTSESAFEESEFRDGKVAVVRTYSVTNPTTMKIARQNKQNGKLSEQTARRR